MGQTALIRRNLLVYPANREQYWASSGAQPSASCALTPFFARKRKKATGGLYVLENFAGTVVCTDYPLCGRVVLGLS